MQVATGKTITDDKGAQVGEMREETRAEIHDRLTAFYTERATSGDPVIAANARMNLDWLAMFSVEAQEIIPATTDTAISDKLADHENRIGTLTGTVADMAGEIADLKLRAEPAPVPEGPTNGELIAGLDARVSNLETLAEGADKK